DVHVEEMELAIARDDRAVGLDGEARVEEALVTGRSLQETPADDVHAVPAREPREELRGGAGGRVGDLARLSAAAEVREELGQHRQLGAARRGLAQQALCR